MSISPDMRRKDLVMPEQRALDTLERGFRGWLATAGADGSPYCIPLLYVLMDGQVYLHYTIARGHLRANIDHESKVCFGVDEPDEVFAYGRFECDTGLAYRSVVLFGEIRVISDTGTKQKFCQRLMAKYGKQDWNRPKDFFPRLDQITVCAITRHRITGKETSLPEISRQWPAMDRTKSPPAPTPERGDTGT